MMLTFLHILMLHCRPVISSSVQYQSCPPPPSLHLHGSEPKRRAQGRHLAAAAPSSHQSPGLCQAPMRFCESATKDMDVR